jgi:hypothetical protein
LTAVYLIAGIIAILFTIDAAPRLGYTLLAVVVLGMLIAGRRNGYI